ncbi:MAG TPA: GuaB3 family IMP dehydrogenase-related protein [Kineosporiaceae bacterium]|nr:GuaB3 family IMP dehydrogenase-related protein [Kineosporiaceae bacterium]
MITKRFGITVAADSLVGVNEIEIGRGKRGRRAYTFDDVAIVPSRRTRDPEEVSVAWQIDAYRFELPVVAAPMDSVTSPVQAVALGRLGGLGVLDLEGLWTRYEDPEPLLGEIASLDPRAATRRMQQIYAQEINPDLMAERVKEIRDAGVTVAGALTPQRTQQFWKTVVDAGVDLFVIRGTTVSAEHVSGRAEPLNLKRFIYELDVPVIVGGCATYTAALHLMRTGAAGVLVGFGGGATHTTRTTLGIHAPMATAIADVAAARRDYMDESGGRYVHVIADGGMGRSGEIVKAVACGADAVMLGAALARAVEAPGSGYHWGPEAHHPLVPRGERVHVGTVGTLEEILLGPGRIADGTTNLIGALRRSMATTGYSDLKEFQRVEVVVSPYRPS